MSKVLTKKQIPITVKTQITGIKLAHGMRDSIYTGVNVQLPN